MDWQHESVHQGRTHGEPPGVQVALAVSCPWLCRTAMFVHVSPRRAWRQLLPKVKLVVSVREPGQCVASMYKFWNPMVCGAPSQAVLSCGGVDPCPHGTRLTKSNGPQWISGRLSACSRARCTLTRRQSLNGGNTGA